MQGSVRLHRLEHRRHARQTAVMRMAHHCMRRRGRGGAGGPSRQPSPHGHQPSQQQPRSVSDGMNRMCVCVKLDNIVERNILGASPSMQDHILSVATRCATEPYSAAPPRRGTGPLPSSDAEASTDRAPRPAEWASTALSSGRVVVRGADVTGGKRGAAGRAGASRGRKRIA